MTAASGSHSAPLIDPRRLLVFREVARGGSLSAAAVVLGWTQPAVAQHIRRLEREVGVPLVTRSPQGVRLTEAGQVLAGHGDAVAARLHAAAEDIAALTDLRAGRVRLAAFPSAAATFVPAAMALLARRAPGLQVALTEVEPPEARALLAAGDVDLAVSFSYANVPEPADPRVAAEHLFDEPVRLVLHLDHPLARHATADLADVAAERWVAGCPRCRAHLQAAASVRGFHPDIRHTTDDYVVTQTLVAAGLGVALLPALALAAAPHPGVASVALADDAVRRVDLLQPAGLPLGPGVRALRDVLIEEGTARVRLASEDHEPTPASPARHAPSTRLVRHHGNARR